MKNHDLLVLGMSAIWILTNFLGAAFTFKRVYSGWKGQSRWMEPDDGFRITLIRPKLVLSGRSLALITAVSAIITATLFVSLVH